MDNLNKLSSAEISNIIDQKEKELSQAIKDYFIIEQEKLILQKTILEHQTCKKDLEISLSKAGHILRQLNIELKLLRSKFWSNKNAGL
jgi:hypothetical protein